MSHIHARHQTTWRSCTIVANEHLNHKPNGCESGISELRKFRLKASNFRNRLHRTYDTWRYLQCYSRQRIQCSVLVSEAARKTLMTTCATAELGRKIEVDRNRASPCR